MVDFEIDYDNIERNAQERRNMIMKDILSLIVFLILYLCLLIEQILKAKKDGLDKLGVIGLILATAGIVLVIISSLAGK